MASGGPPLARINPPGGLSVSSSSLTGGNTIATTGPLQLTAQQGNQEAMMSTNIVTSTSTSPTPSDSTSVSAESGKSGLAGKMGYCFAKYGSVIKLF